MGRAAHSTSDGHSYQHEGGCLGQPRLVHGVVWVMVAVAAASCAGFVLGPGVLDDPGSTVQPCNPRVVARVVACVLLLVLLFVLLLFLLIILLPTTERRARGCGYRGSISPTFWLARENFLQNVVYQTNQLFFFLKIKQSNFFFFFFFFQ